MKVRVIRVLEMIGEETWVGITLDKSIGTDGFKFPSGTITELVRIKETIGEGTNDNKGV
jgi:hypothetical protein